MDLQLATPHHVGIPKTKPVTTGTGEYPGLVKDSPHLLFRIVCCCFPIGCARVLERVLFLSGIRWIRIFGRGPVPSPYMLFVHDVAPEWRDRLSAVTHVDGTARIQTVDPVTEPLLHRMLAAFERRTGVPVVVNTSFNTAGRPMVDSPRDALECFGSAPIDLLAMGPFAVRRPR